MAGVIGTLGTIPVAVVYLVLNLAVPVYFVRHERSVFSVWKHLIVPVMGCLFLILPLWGLIQPGQPAPFNLFPGIVLGVLILALVYGVIRQRQIPDLVSAWVALSRTKISESFGRPGYAPL